jgi:hypothetical protein
MSCTRGSWGSVHRPHARRVPVGVVNQSHRGAHVGLVVAVDHDQVNVAAPVGAGNRRQRPERVTVLQPARRASHHVAMDVHIPHHLGVKGEHVSLGLRHEARGRDDAVVPVLLDARRWREREVVDEVLVSASGIPSCIQYRRISARYRP